MDSAIRPVQKIGIETPARAIVIALRSKTDPRFRADRTPVATPKPTHSTAAPRASENVTGIRSRISGHTGCRLMNEKPRQGAGQCSISAPMS